MHVSMFNLLTKNASKSREFFCSSRISFWNRSSLVNNSPNIICLVIERYPCFDCKNSPTEKTEVHQGKRILNISPWNSSKTWRGFTCSDVGRNKEPKYRRKCFKGFFIDDIMFANYQGNYTKEVWISAKSAEV